MKTPEKIAIGIAAAVVVGGLTALGLRKKKKISSPKTFNPPYGNIYPENHIYRTFDNQYFKNGRKIKYQTPAQSIENVHGHFDQGKVQADLRNHDAPNPSVDYHQRGVRHR